MAMIIRMNNNAFSYHFNYNPKTKDNPYIKIDALVWAIVYAEKVERYADEVYLFSEYIIKNYEAMK